MTVYGERNEKYTVLSTSFIDFSICISVSTLILSLWLLRGFSNTETLCSEYKYYCEECRSKQEAHKRLVCMFVLIKHLLATVEC